jgi:uncharacterized alkaline shock family protein YloU
VSTAALAGPAPTGRHTTPADNIDEMNERGRTSLSDRVIEKTAAAAALEVDHVHGAARGLAAAVFNTDPAVGVQATIDGHLAQLRLDVEVDYPVSLRKVTRNLRRHVSDRVQALCEITVTDVDVHVTALRQHTQEHRRVR